MIIVQLDTEQLSDLIQRSVRAALKKDPAQTLTSTGLPDQLLTIQQAADFLHLSVPTVYTQVSRGELPVMKRNKRLYFSRTELMEYLKEGRKKMTCEIETEAEAHIRSHKKG